MTSLMDDDYDPLAPMHVDEPGVEEEDDGRGGFSDGDNIVRVWLDGDDLARVRVSFAWRERLGHKDLGDCFSAALAAARLRIPAPLDTDPEATDLSGVDFDGLPEFSGDVFHTFRMAFDNFNQRWEEALERAQVEPERRDAPIEAEFDEVIVRLNHDGQVDAVEFDDDWLEDAEARDIMDAVMEAAKRARAQYEPEPDRSEELRELAREHEILRKGLLATVTGRQPR